MNPALSQRGSHRLLVVDDDVRLLASLSKGLRLKGFEVATASSAGDAVSSLEATAPELVILDVAMPGMDGLTFCRLLRHQSSVPILMLSARDEIHDRVSGLEAGADDYLVKPFDLEELTARVRALLRRSSAAVKAEFRTCGELELDRRTWRATLRGKSLALTSIEFLILEQLMIDPSRVCSRDDLLRAAWGAGEADAESNVIDVHVSNLRKKLSVTGGGPIIRAVRGVGYALDASDETTD
jgi:DNA-binding response OmpR family regulator